MKAILLLAVTLGLSTTAFAVDEGQTEAGKHEEGHAAGGHRDNAALFPPRKADASKATAPVKPKLLEPSFQQDVAGEAVVLKWEGAPTADVYHVQVATDPNFKWLKVDDHLVRATNLEVKGLEKGKTYFWRVAGWKNDNMAATNHGEFSRSVFEVK